MNIVSVIDLPGHLRDDYSRELLSLSENLIRSVSEDQLDVTVYIQKLSVSALEVKPFVAVYVKPKNSNIRDNSPFHISNTLLLKLQLGKGELYLEYVSRLKQGKLYWYFDHIPLTIPGSVERIQDIIYKTVKIYFKWIHTRTKTKSKPKPKTKIAHRRT